MLYEVITLSAFRLRFEQIQADRLSLLVAEREHRAIRAIKRRVNHSALFAQRVFFAIQRRARLIAADQAFYRALLLAFQLRFPYGNRLFAVMTDECRSGFRFHEKRASYNFV